MAIRIEMETPQEEDGNATGGRWKRHTRKIGAVQLTEMKDIQKRWVV